MSQSMGLKPRGEWVTPEEVAAVKQWWRQRLVQRGWEPDSLRTVGEFVDFDVTQGLMTGSNTLDEQIFNLD